MNLSTSHWSRLYGKALGSATLKQEIQDFVVEEQLGFAPTGKGEHIFLWLEKTNLNTAFVAEELAKFSKLALRDITYAGRKDKFALTRQWFGVHIANKQEPDWSQFSLPGASILQVTRNDRKLRVGVLKGNKFDLTLRNLHQVDISELEHRLEQIKQKGAPNYYGSQRFGEMRATQAPDANGQTATKLIQGGNLALGEKLVAGEDIRNRNKRSMAISALRSWLFNEIIHTRIKQDCFHHPLSGDAMQLSGSNSFFVSEDENIDSKTLQRLGEFDINITAPLWGDGKLHTTYAAKALEQQCAKLYPDLVRSLNSLGLKQERRAIRTVPQEFAWQIEDNNLKMQFTLPAGCFATSIVRELLEV